MIMADVFDFQDDEGEGSSSLPSHSGEKISQEPSPSESQSSSWALLAPAESSTRPDTKALASRSRNLSTGGRTRHARNRKRQADELVKKKEKELDKKKQDEEEREKGQLECKKPSSTNDWADDDSASAFSTSATSARQSSLKESSVAPRRKRRRKQLTGERIGTKRIGSNAPSAKRRITDSLSPFGNEAFSPLVDSSSSISEQIKQKLQQHERQQNRLCPSPAKVVSRKIGGAGRNVYAVQDAGNHQMIHDECSELTSTILSCPRASISDKSVVIESAAELAVMLSSTKTRRILWQSESVADGNSTVLTGILDVVHHITTALAENSQEIGGRLLPLGQRLQPTSKGAGLNETPRAQPRQTNLVENYNTLLLLDSLVSVLSFISWDVTIEKKHSAFHKSAREAKALRASILRHQGFLCSAMYLIRYADPIVSAILEEAKAVAILSLVKPSSPVEFQECPDPDATPHTRNNKKVKHDLSDFQKAELAFKVESQDVGFSQESDLSSLNKGQGGDGRSVTSIETSSSKGTRDPTVQGRRKRRRKKGGAVLDPIAEDALSFSGATGAVRSRTPPRSPPRFVIQKNVETNDACTKLSFQSEDTFSPSRSPSRRRDALSAHDGDDGSSMVSCDSALLRVHDLLDQARAKFIRAPGRSEYEKHEHHNDRELHRSFGGKEPPGVASALALGALQRLLVGKEEGDSQSCMDAVDEEPPEQGQSDNTDFMPHMAEADENMDGDANDDELLRNNPLLETNRLIGESEVIPSLAQGMAEILSALVEELCRDEPSKACQACLQHLHDKFQALAPIVDNACLLYSNNRMDLCTATSSISTDEVGDGSGVLVGSLLLFLNCWLRQDIQFNCSKSKRLVTLLNEVALSALRTLTSLTHDNSLSAEQFAVKYQDLSVNEGGNRYQLKTTLSWTGVEVVSQILYRAATDTNLKTSKTAYDTRIFCLNTLANIVGEDADGQIRTTFSCLECRKGDESVAFLSWLAEWLVGQTQSFRNAIMKGSFGSKQNGDSEQHSDRELDRHEHDQLVTAGNGCVLLACLLMEPPKDANKERMAKVVQNVRELILTEMPLDDRNGLPSGTTFLKNTLRAFSNFLYYSVGDLSVAVVAPVRKLITSLDKMEIEVV